METYSVFPDNAIVDAGPVAGRFLSLGIQRFHGACRYVHELPYGYNSDRDNLMILFIEKKGSCTTKHAVIGTLAAEMDLPVVKHIGIYAMTEEIVTGTDRILDKYALPYLPMVHCFLVCGDHRVDLTEGNQNGKNRSIDHFLYTERVEPNISARDEYLRYRQGLRDILLKCDELKGAGIQRILRARQEGLELLKARVEAPG
jgi:hypothetical protein